MDSDREGELDEPSDFVRIVESFKDSNLLRTDERILELLIPEMWIHINKNDWVQK